MFLYSILVQNPKTMFILMVYIYLPCINTQLQKTAPFDENPVISYNDHQKTGLYQGSTDRCEGKRNFDLIHLLQKCQDTHYCNQSVLAIALDLNIFVFSITIVDLIWIIALVCFRLLFVIYLYNSRFYISCL